VQHAGFPITRSHPPAKKEQVVPAFSHPLILVTNDDGIGSPGLQAAAQAVRPLGELVVAAPRFQQTSAGRGLPASFTGRIYEETLAIDGERIPAYAVEGSPAQAVQHAILELTPRLPDLVVSGINYGENLGSGVTVSGTVGATLEAATFGITGLATSLGVQKKHHLSHSKEVDFDTAAFFTAYFARLILTQELPFDSDLLKLDVPANATPETPWRITRVSRQRYFVPVAARQSPLSMPGPMDYERALDLKQLEPDSDIYAFAIDQVVSVSPISFDLTARVELAQLERQLRREKPTLSVV
jgi:5'-nucleotidase